MENKFLRLGGGVLIFALLAANMAMAQDFKFDIKPYYQDYSNAELTQYEVGGSLLRTYMRLMTTSGTQTMMGVKAHLGALNPFPASGYDYNKIEATGKTEFDTGLFNWNMSVGGLNYNNTKGEITYVRGVNTSGSRRSVSTTPVNMYQIDFRLKDADANAGQAALKYDNMYGVGGGQNSASGPAGNNLIAEDPFNFTILAAAPPQDFAGVGSVNDTTKGNTLKIDFTALSNRIGEKDWTPPVKYDVYRSTTSFSPNDATNRVITDITPSGAFTYTGGASTVNDGPNSGVPGSSPNNLSDCAEYYYTMRAKDSTIYSPNSIVAPQHKTTNTDTLVVGPFKPHDYTAPPAPTGLSLAQGDGQITVNWANPGVPDFGGVIVVRKEGAAPSPVLQSAAGDNDGAASAVDAIMSDGSRVVYKGTGSSFTDSNLTNGVNYFYAVYAFDRAVAGPPREQGYNYSPAAAGSRAPGVAPASVQDQMALADPNTGDITLRWTNPILTNGAIDLNKTNGYGGAKLVFTTDFAKWNAINVDSAAADPAVFQTVERPIPNVADPTATPVSDGITIPGLATDQVYFFKVFTYNITPVPETRVYDAGVKVAALPAKGGAGATTTEKQLGAIRVSLATGVNQFGIPFQTPFYIIKAGVSYEVNNLQNLVDALNSNNSDITVNAIAYYDNVNRQLYGATFNANGTVAFQNFSINLSDVQLTPGKGYQISVSKNTEIIIVQKIAFEYSPDNLPPIPTGTTAPNSTINTFSVPPASTIKTYSTTPTETIVPTVTVTTQPVTGTTIP